jgi:Grx4 family monothiol glutaredoxin
MATALVEEISSEGELQALHSSHKGLTVVLLWAPWHPASAHLASQVLDRLAADKKVARFGKVNTDICSSLATKLGANQVPFVAFLDPKGNKIDSLAGPDAPSLYEKVTRLAARPMDSACEGSGACAGSGESGATGEQDLNAELKTLINYSPVMLFMKGAKTEPFCKFSKQAIAMLNEITDDYSTFDILQNNKVREGLKEYSNWKTYPQLYIQGELVGGIDIMKEMNDEVEPGSTDSSLKKVILAAASPEVEESLEDKLKAIINQETVMLMMKGNPEQPRCGFSRKMSELLKEQKVEFGTFDILSDQEVREGLKSYSNWQTYPQLYSNGKLIGGLDIVLELVEEGNLFEEMGIESKL